MRITSTARYFFLLMIGVGGLAALMIYLITYQEHIALIIGECLMVIVVCFLMYVIFAPLFTFLGERAEDIMAVYTDASGKGLHIFSSFSVSRVKVGLAPLRTIQYYFLATETRRLYYKVLLTHSMESVSGHSGYEGFSSFEEDVLEGEAFKKAIERFSEKAGWPLKLGKAARQGEEEDYATTLNDRTYKIQTSKGLIQDTMKLYCYDENGKLRWRKKL